jgi:ABC-2 type transport system ATP-binding protein
MSIEVRHVTKVFGQQKALDSVSFSVGRGRVVGFLGPNGAGKSTMMRIITCYLPQTSGTVHVCGHDTATDSMNVRRKVGYLPEANPLYPDMYVREYLQFVAGLYGLKDGKIRAERMIELTGLAPERNKQIGQLSKGYKQRVGLAQAMIHDPEVLILDEPTSGLDPNQLVGIRALIRELGRDRTVLFSSHIMQEVEAVSDQVIIIDRGHVVTDRPTTDLKGLTGPMQSIRVEFDRATDVQRLRKELNLRDVRSLEGNCYRLVAATEADIRPDVARWAQANGFLTLSMTIEEAKLEEIFQELTGKKKG